MCIFLSIREVILDFVPSRINNDLTVESKRMYYQRMLSALKTVLNKGSKRGYARIESHAKNARHAEREEERKKEKEKAGLRREAKGNVKSTEP